MEIFAYSLLAVSVAFLIALLGWQIGCWFSEIELNRRMLEQERKQARRQAKAKSKTRVNNTKY